MVKVRK